jgi:hypothetical protein
MGNQDQDLAAYIWAKRFNCNTIIKFLTPGDLFRFPSSPDVCVYKNRGWYTCNNKKYRTGMRTGVIKLDQ